MDFYSVYVTAHHIELRLLERSPKQDFHPHILLKRRIVSTHPSYEAAYNFAIEIARLKRLPLLNYAGFIR